MGIFNRRYSKLPHGDHRRVESDNRWAQVDSPNSFDTRPQDYSQGYKNPYVNTPDAPVYDNTSAKDNEQALRALMENNRPPQLRNRWDSKVYKPEWGMPLKRAIGEKINQKNGKGFHYESSRRLSMSSEDMQITPIEGDSKSFKVAEYEIKRKAGLGTKVEQEALGKFTITFSAALLREPSGHPDGDKLMDNFISGSGKGLVFDENTNMSKILAQTSAFQEFSKVFEQEIKKYFNTNKNIEKFDGNKYIKDNYPKYGLGSGNPLGSSIEFYAKATMGGIQEIDIDVTIENRQMTLLYTLGDVFGTSLDDAFRSNLPGLPELYYLQHYMSQKGKKYVPFFWWVEIKHKLTL